jgi:hypothetical protein
MIPMFCAIWIYRRHGIEAAIICALVWGVMDAADHVLKRYTGSSMVEHVFGISEARNDAP